MTSALQLWISIGSLLLIVGGAILLKYTGLENVTSEIFSWIRELWSSFLNVAPKYLKVLFFLFFVLTFGGWVVGGVMNFNYLCNSDGELRTYKHGIAGGVIGSFQSIFVGYQAGSDDSDCIGERNVYDCISFNETECDFFYNKYCDWDVGDAECIRIDWYDWARNCDYMVLNNSASCGLLGCEFISNDIQWDNFVGNKTVSAQVYDPNTPEGMFYPQCVNYDPVLTFHGINLFSFRTWLILILIIGLFGLAVKLKSR